MNRLIHRLQWHACGLVAACCGVHAAAAATIDAASCSQPAVQSAVNSASNGDVVRVPAGTCTWSSPVKIGPKAITLQGAGVKQTNIVHSASGSQVKLIQFTEHATLPTRITGFSFSGGTYDRRFIGCWGNGNYTSAPMRIDHNSFISGSGSIQVDLFSCRGLLDHNAFTADGNSELIHVWGPGTAGWSADVTPGSANATYIEDNTFYNGNQGGSTWNAQSAVQAYDAARVVIRYNTFNNQQVDTHGGSNIGTRWFEIYENTFNDTISGWIRGFDIRAGSGVIFNNDRRGSGYNPDIALRYECRSGDTQYRVGEGYARAHWSPVYIWSNDSDFKVTTDRGSCGEGPQAGVNYFVSSGKPSSMKRLQKAGDSSSTTYSYSPFLYPYPLTAGGMPNPAGSSSLTLPAPQEFRIMQ